MKKSLCIPIFVLNWFIRQ